MLSRGDDVSPKSLELEVGGFWWPSATIRNE